MRSGILEKRLEIVQYNTKEAPKEGIGTAIGCTTFPRMVEWWQGGININLDTPYIYFYIYS
jgi:hypothetical protein